ncbi:MAG: glyoxalase [Sphingomonadales bacterium]|nr:glyoxalase [Sphingomonadales bacterium]
MTVIAIDHVQLAMPIGAEDAARAFYAGLLGIPEVPKPMPLAARGGCWFETGAVRLHLGAEADFRPARKAHPALVVADYAGLCARLEASGHAVRHDDELAGVVRGFVDDPFGNRIELIAQPVSPSQA